MNLTPSHPPSLRDEDVRRLRAENEALRSLLEEREHERALMRRQEVALRTVLANIPYAVWWKDRDSVYMGCNERLAKLAGRPTPAAMVGVTDFELPWKEEEARAYREDDRAVAVSGVPKIDIEESQLNADGVETVLLTSKVPLRDDDGRIIGTLGTFTDITARKKMERELAKAKDVAEAANKAKTAFLSNVSHELRTPLTLVLGPLDTLAERADLPEDARTTLRCIQRNAWRLKQLVDDILDFTKTEAGKANVVLEEVAVDTVLASLVEDIRPAADSRQIKLVGSFEAPSPRTAVDRRMLEKIALNLIGNALKFTPAGGEVTVSLTGDDDALRICVRDTGIGIAPEDQARLFQRFEQVDASTTRRFEGTGLGLALVKEFASLLGGTVGVESAPGAGSRFWVRLPRRHFAAGSSAPSADEGMLLRARELARTEHTRPEPEIDPRATSPQARPGDTRPRVVVAEDHRDLRDYIVKVLETDYQVSAFPNGAAALEAVKREPPDVIISDVMMPEMDGTELVTRLKADPDLTHVPVILLTARADREVLVSSLKGGADDFLHKPFDPAELKARIDVALRLHRTHNELVTRNQELVATRDMLIQAEKLAATGRLLAQLSHEINNPMCIIVGNLPLIGEYVDALAQLVEEHQSLAENLPTYERERFAAAAAALEIDDALSELRAGLRDIDEAASRVGGIQDDLRAFLRGEDVSMLEGNINEAIQVTIDVVKRGMSPGVEIRADFGPAPPLTLHAGQMKQVFLNLLKNALDATGERGVIEVETRASGDVMTINVTDSGPGVPEHVRARIFEPFFTTKDASYGSGIGLAVSSQIVRQHGGTLRLDPEHVGGARFVIELPLRNRNEAMKQEQARR